MVAEGKEEQVIDPLYSFWIFDIGFNGEVLKEGVCKRKKCTAKQPENRVSLKRSVSSSGLQI